MDITAFFLPFKEKDFLKGWSITAPRLPKKMFRNHSSCKESADFISEILSHTLKPEKQQYEVKLEKYRNSHPDYALMHIFLIVE